MKKKSIRILCMILLFTFSAAGCSNANNEVKDGDKNAEKAVGVMDIYDKKRDKYTGDADYHKGYEVYGRR